MSSQKGVTEKSAVKYGSSAASPFVGEGDARTGRRKPVVRARYKYDSPSDVAVHRVAWPCQWPVFPKQERDNH